MQHDDISSLKTYIFLKKSFPCDGLLGPGPQLGLRALPGGASEAQHGQQVAPEHRAQAGGRRGGAQARLGVGQASEHGVTGQNT